MKQHFGFWTLLNDESEKSVNPLISRLSETYGNGISFVPHISVYKSQHIELGLAKDSIDSIAEDVKPFEVEVESVDYEQHDWSRTLFLKIKTHPSLDEISSRLEDYFGEPYELFPHLSLVYSETISESEKKWLTKELEFPRKLTVAKLAIVNPNSASENWRDYSKWTLDYVREI